MFEVGNKLGKGRIPGTGKRTSIANALQEYLREEVNGKPRLDEAIGRLYGEDLKTFMAYAFGKPIETQISVTPEDTKEELELAVARVLANGSALKSTPVEN